MHLGYVSSSRHIEGPIGEEDEGRMSREEGAGVRARCSGKIRRRRLGANLLSSPRKSEADLWQKHWVVGRRAEEGGRRTDDGQRKTEEEGNDVEEDNNDDEDNDDNPDDGGVRREGRVGSGRRPPQGEPGGQEDSSVAEGALPEAREAEEDARGSRADGGHDEREKEEEEEKGNRRRRRRGGRGIGGGGGAGRKGGIY